MLNPPGRQEKPGPAEELFQAIELIQKGAYYNAESLLAQLISYDFSSDAGESEIIFFASVEYLVLVKNKNIFVKEADAEKVKKAEQCISNYLEILKARSTLSDQQKYYLAWCYLEGMDCSRKKDLKTAQKLLQPLIANNSPLKPRALNLFAYIFSHLLPNDRSNIFLAIQLYNEGAENNPAAAVNLLVQILKYSTAPTKEEEVTKLCYNIMEQGHFFGPLLVRLCEQAALLNDSLIPVEGDSSAKIIYELTGVNKYDVPLWYYIEVIPSKLFNLLSLKNEFFNVREFGSILYSGFGSQPSKAITQKVLSLPAIHGQLEDLHFQHNLPENFFHLTMTQPSRQHIFISHAHPVNNDEKWTLPHAKMLQRILKETLNADVIIDTEEIPQDIGGSVKDFMRVHITKADIILVLITKSMLEKLRKNQGSAIVFEITEILFRVKKKDSALILPIFINTNPLSTMQDEIGDDSFIAERDYLDWSQNTAVTENDCQDIFFGGIKELTSMLSKFSPKRTKKTACHSKRPHCLSGFFSQPPTQLTTFSTSPLIQQKRCSQHMSDFFRQIKAILETVPIKERKVFINYINFHFSSGAQAIRWITSYVAQLQRDLQAVGLIVANPSINLRQDINESRIAIFIGSDTNRYFFNMPSNTHAINFKKSVIFSIKKFCQLVLDALPSYNQSYAALKKTLNTLLEKNEEDNYEDFISAWQSLMSSLQLIKEEVNLPSNFLYPLVISGPCETALRILKTVIMDEWDPGRSGWIPYDVKMLSLIWRILMGSHLELPVDVRKEIQQIFDIYQKNQKSEVTRDKDSSNPDSERYLTCFFP